MTVWKSRSCRHGTTRSMATASSKSAASSTTDGRVLPFSLDFDVIAHEVGHAIIFSVLGVPGPGTEYPEYVGFQEAFSDCVSLIAAMHFPSVIDNVLGETRGNLYLANRLSRFSEFSPHRQIRSANNKRTMAEFVHGWKNEHDAVAAADRRDIRHSGRYLSREPGGARPDLARGRGSRRYRRGRSGCRGAAAGRIRPRFARDADGFREALLDARDVVGTYLAETLWALGPDFLDYGDVATAMLAVDRGRDRGQVRKAHRAQFQASGDRRVARRHAHQRPRIAAIPIRRAPCCRETISNFRG